MVTGIDYRLSFSGHLSQEKLHIQGRAHLEISRERLQIRRGSPWSHTQGHWHSNSLGVGPLPLLLQKMDYAPVAPSASKCVRQGGVDVVQFSVCSVAVVGFCDSAVFWLRHWRFLTSALLPQLLWNDRPPAKVLLHFQLKPSFPVKFCQMCHVCFYLRWPWWCCSRQSGNKFE